MKTLKRLLLALLLLVTLGLAAVVGVFAYYGQDLPSFDKLEDYHPPQTTKVFDRNGVLVAEYFHERRTVVPEEEIPELLKQAIIAAEDASFYEHEGLDYLGIVRAMIKDLRHLRMAQGASTITQQVVKNMVLSSERSLARKVKEAILARRLEQNLTKEEILYLYVNQIYFGHLRYGIEEAAWYFFARPVRQLSLGEVALLAGLPQSPARLSPVNHPAEAKRRQTYVLEQMARAGFITREQADAEIARPITLAPRAFEPVGPYYAEDVRRALIERYGETIVHEGGLRVELAMDRALQILADASLATGLEELDLRFGYRPSEVVVPPVVLEAARPKLLARHRSPGRDPLRAVATIWDFTKVTKEGAASGDQLLEGVGERPLEAGAVVTAPLISVSDLSLTVDLGRRRGVATFDSLRWARAYSPAKSTRIPENLADLFVPGQLVRVRVLAKPATDREPVPLAVAPAPSVQGALVAIDPESRHVLAMAGGYDFASSAFNRVTQARRQPGSAFKPFLYGAALASGKFTAASIVNDAPDLFRDPWTGKEWKPKNFEDNEFEGPMPLRRALARSKNTVAVRLIEAVGTQAVVDFARKAGVESPLNESLTLALGTGEVSPLELANGYATLAALGRRADPVTIVRVTDRSGKVLEEHHAVPEETIPPPVAFVLTSMMRSVIEYDYGTGHAATALKRPIAGKTGTASDGRDAWFAAFTPDLVAVAWTGFDDHASMGQGMTGGRGALPTWMRFMSAALEKRPKLDFPVPPGLEVVTIDPQSGLRAAEGAVGREEFFVEGTAPQDVASRPGEADKKMLFLEDGGMKRR